MVSSAASRGDSQERKSFLDKPSSSKKTKSAADASEKSSKSEKSGKSAGEKSAKSAVSTTKSAKSVKSTDNSAKSVKSVKSVKSETRTRTEKTLKSQRTMTSSQSVGRRGPKMSDGTEFDTGPYGYIFSFIYLFVLWGLAIIAAIGLVYFNYARLDPQYPSYFGDGSFLGKVPKATFDPNPRRFQEEGPKNLMEWNIYDFRTYVNLLIRYKHVLKNYSAKKGNKNVEKKRMCKEKNLTRTEACAFDRFEGFGDCILSEENLEHGFGFSKGQPCIMLKLNKIVGWYPDLKNKTNCNSTNLCCGPGIQFKCESNDDVQFEYLPKDGIPSCYFPFSNQKGYEQPYQMVKVANLTFNKETTIECYPTDRSLRDITDGKRNEARFHILMKHESPGNIDE
ncbi:unnamed protein product [Caenorhabditis sp. 36 PRJEB53466]|nr:unnamed protein product [Caenorhabditis sp. 36 PRJEB53466]